MNSVKLEPDFYAVVSIATDPHWDEDDKEPYIESTWKTLVDAQEEKERISKESYWHEGTEFGIRAYKEIIL